MLIPLLALLYVLIIYLILDTVAKKVGKEGT